MSSAKRIPLAAKLLYSAFVAVLVPVYWREYGPTNFLYFCDVALLLTVPALWLENGLLASIALVGILLPQALWMVDFVCELLGFTLTGISGYMIDDKLPLFTRGLSFFHFWLPLFLLWVVYRLGYDRRAYWWCVVGGCVLVLICYLFLPAPPAPPDRPNLPVNVNYVYGFGEERQTWMPQPLYLTLMSVVLVGGLYLPAHLVLQRWLTKRAQ